MKETTVEGLQCIGCIWVCSYQSQINTKILGVHLLFSKVLLSIASTFAAFCLVPIVVNFALQVLMDKCYASYKEMNTAGKIHVWILSWGRLRKRDDICHLVSEQFFRWQLFQVFFSVNFMNCFKAPSSAYHSWQFLWFSPTLSKGSRVGISSAPL